MVSVEDAVIARISKSGMNFEIMVDPDKALEFKRGKEENIENVLAVTEIFKDCNKGERHSSEDLQKSFGTTDVFEVAKKIVTEGEIQLTTEQRNRFTEDKKKEIANIISRQGIDPKTKLPHPSGRILNAMKEAHVLVDPFRPAKEQVKNVLEKIQEVLPISLERIEIAIRVPIEHAGKANSIVREITDVKKEEWTSNAWIAVIEIPAGMQSDIYDRLNKLTGGKVEVKIIKEHKL
ncbi:MAG: ribosome assembly factor SBDS [Candidatus Aenigmarchaeota archaeon]|nr:ribosome assembly factor SBDS [Candidatus Aenigmarchaeota archaeon]